MKTIKGNYSIHIQAEDYGCGVDKFYITLEESIDSISKENITIKETKQNTDWTDPTFPIVIQSTNRTILDAYLVKDNTRTEEPSNTFIVECAINPIEGSPFLFSMRSQYNTWSDPFKNEIQVKCTSKGESVECEIDSKVVSKYSDVDLFEKHKETFEDIPYEYVTYSPKKESDVLFVWLHGMGEGGAKVNPDLTNIEVTILANKVTALAFDPFQSTLNGVHILAMQCPTYWMDTKGDQSNFNGALINATRESYYTKSLAALIDSYAQKIKARKVLIGGCSNGGYMTMNMAMNYGNKYDGYVPICEAMPNSEITEEDIETLSNLPMYFVYSEDDDIVKPELHEIPTIQRLRKKGATNLHVSTTKHVVDTSGKYKGEDGNPVQYVGHWSWVYFFNDETSDAEGCSAFRWLSTLI